MQLQPVVLIFDDLDRVFDFEMRRLEREIPDEDERMLAQWRSPWRREALEHYLKLGWSMSLHDSQGEMVAYFLAQPFLFMRCQTQTLWVEHVGGTAEAHRLEALEVAVRLARDKHLQRVLVQKQMFAGQELVGAESPLKNIVTIADQLFEMKTTKG